MLQSDVCQPTDINGPVLPTQKSLDIVRVLYRFHLAIYTAVHTNAFTTSVLYCGEDL